MVNPINRDTKIGELKESLNSIINEIRNCDVSDKKTIKYLFNRKINLMKEIDLYNNKKNNG